jgi:hypothetical protein
MRSMAHELTSHPARRLAAAAITCAAILMPVTALAAAGSAATAGSPASGARPARSVTAYIVNGGNKAGADITVGNNPKAIAITPIRPDSPAAPKSGPTPAVPKTRNATLASMHRVNRVGSGRVDAKGAL